MQWSFHCFLFLVHQQVAASFLCSSYTHLAKESRSQTVSIQSEEGKDRDGIVDRTVEITTDLKGTKWQQGEFCDEIYKDTCMQVEYTVIYTLLTQYQ